MIWLEILANAAMTVSIVLAARNSAHTWWTGIAACLLFAALFAHAKLYADVTLQFFFVVTSAMGWRQWGVSRRRPERPIGAADGGTLFQLIVCGAIGAVVYGWLLHRWTDAYAPFLDSLVLASSIVAQLLPALTPLAVQSLADASTRLPPGGHNPRHRTSRRR